MHKTRKAELVAGGTASGKARKLDPSGPRTGLMRVRDRVASRKGTAREALDIQRKRVWNAASDLGVVDRAVLTQLVLHADGDGETWVGVRRIALQTGASESSVWRSLSRLRDRGLVASRIEITPRGRRNRYRIDLAGGGAANEGGGVQQRASVQGEGTRPLMVTGSPPGSPSCDRSQVNDPPLPPAPVTVLPVVRVIAQERRSIVRFTESNGERDAVWRVLAHFMATLHPESTGPIDTPDRRRLVAARLREFSGDEQTLCDAVIGAKHSTWHRERDIGYRADVVFRNADTIEQLAAMGRRKRLEDARFEHRDPPPLAARPEAPVARASPAIPLASWLQDFDAVARRAVAG